MIVFLNGQFIKAEKAKISIFDHGFLYGDGVYETLRSSQDKIWQLDEHLQRLKNSAKLLQLQLPYPLEKIGHLIQETVKQNGFQESRIRITLTRGINQFDFITCPKPTLSIQVQPLKAEPLEIYKRGVKIVTLQMERTLPESKNISLLPLIKGQQKAHHEKAYETIFVNHKGYVLEGTVTNIFIVKNGLLITPKNNILAGTTRKFLLTITKKNGLKTKIIDFKIAALYAADEIFITNAPRGIIPVIKVNKTKIGTGKPGKITQTIMEIFDKYVKY